MPTGKGGQEGAQVAFSPDGQFLFLAVGDRQRMTPAQDPNQPVGKILRLTLDGKPAPGNPNFGKTGAATIPLIDPPSDTEAAKTAKVVSTYTFPGPNLTPAETWASGVRTPYGLAFSPTGELWEVEHGPRGGDELNLIEKGKNYGWPLVSYGQNYNGVPIAKPRHPARPGEAGALLGPGDRAGQSDVLHAAPRPSRNGTATASSAAWRPSRSSASSLTAMAAPKPPSAGMWATASAMWKQAGLPNAT
jgi:glucose/arabinose dehydrogenase